MTNEHEEYRRKLTVKLNTLIAVLKVAIGKINTSMEQPGANIERLSKIVSNLENTHEVCKRALRTLEGSAPQPVRKVAPSGLREYTELSGIGEYQKFKGMDPISHQELSEVDLDDLIGKLMQ